MENPIYKAKHNEIWKAEAKVNNEICRVLTIELSCEDLNDYRASLNKVNDFQRELEGLVDDILLDPPEGINKNKLARLKHIRDSHLKSVVDLHSNIKIKAANLC